ncbi:GTPase HflX [Ligilactobacillus ceti]|uniref:GTPase HflX n=1 Tax=Ligilactobacillus ceti DSM 22408 TaxID=1122146 RepID=A0A0R2KPL0_9LACO|nr:GTPase HflX [Ligilactobacillus ceti]KRN88359.1 gtp-binding protein [Ligilactobacillus ceti DSM 22408]
MTPVIIAGIETPHNDFTYTMEELTNLVEANHMIAEKQVSQKLDHPLAGSYFGSGKADEIKRLAETYDIDFLIINDELTPTQIRNLERLTNLTIIDRTALILDIFAQRAQSKEAKLQVEIAKLQYQLPRLHTSGVEKLDQQSAGGGMANRGAGEKKIELNRRVIEKKITRARKELKAIAKEKETQRKARDKSGLKTVALVGYTNAGKSTTMNGLLKLTNADEHKKVFEKDMLFATLDTSVRKLKFSDNKEILLSDTVGFVSMLPHQLVAAFKTTLAEAAQADLLIQVVDSSDPNAKEMIATTNKTLQEIGVTDVPMIYAFNKADETLVNYPVITGDEITYSAKDLISLQALSDFIKEQLFRDYQTLTYLIPFNQGHFLEDLNQNAHILKTEYVEQGTLITANVAPELARKLHKFLQK